MNTIHGTGDSGNRIRIPERFLVPYSFRFRVRTVGLKAVMGAWSDPAKILVI